MDRVSLLGLLALTEKQIEEAKSRIALQRAAIRDIQRSGQDASAAQAELDSLEDLALCKMAERDGIQRELALEPLITVSTVPQLAGRGAAATA